MRFRKSVKICKGVRINLSKSGASLTAGTKGASVNIGTKGTYLNTGIPGTGLYNRTQVGCSSAKVPLQNYNSRNNTPIGEIKISYADDGSIQLIDSQNKPIGDQTLIRKIKQTSEYKMELERLNQERLDSYEHEINKIIHIQDQMIPVFSIEQHRAQLNQLKPKQYVIKDYSVPAPTMSDVERDLYQEAKNVITIKKPQKKSKLETQYVEDTKQLEYNRRFSLWNNSKQNYLNSEIINAKKMNQQYLLEYEQQKTYIQQLLDCDENTITYAIEYWLKTVDFPFDFNVQFKQKGSLLYIDLDLPEIENMIQKKAQKMKNGTVKIKNKTQKEIKEDYSECVFGLALFFASHIFNIAIGLTEVIISGYTQRRNKIGDIIDDYIYSISFQRNMFMSLRKNSSAREKCMHFENRCLQNSDLTFKSIEPYKF